MGGVTRPRTHWKASDETCCDRLHWKEAVHALSYQMETFGETSHNGWRPVRQRRVDAGIPFKPSCPSGTPMACGLVVSRRRDKYLSTYRGYRTRLGS